MFKKQPSIKNLAPLRSSDRRKVVDQIIADYSIKVPEIEPVEGQTAEQAQILAVSSLRNTLLPEGCQSARFTTTVGAENRPASGTVYAAQFTNGDMKLYWFKLENQIIPTVYTLWRNPTLLPILQTPDIVLQKMRNGADLMTPGLARGPPFPEKAKKGSIVAIAAYEKPSVPIVVGTCEIDVSALTEVRGVKGHAVRGIHWEGDGLWNWSQGGHAAGVHAPDHLVGFDADPVQSLEQSVAALEVGDGKRVTEATPVPANEKVQTKGDEPDEKPFEEVDAPKKVWEIKDIDLAFKNAFLFAIHDAREKHRDSPTHGISFPIPPSQFISNLIQPYLPTYTREDVAALQIKKTSWKNVRKFIKTLDKEQLVKSKDRSGGETIILDIDFKDQQIDTFQPYSLPKKTTPTDASDASAFAGGLPTTNASDPIGQKIQIVHLLKPHKTLQPIFTVTATDPSALYLPTELRQHITSYIERENLIESSDHGRVKLNPILADALYAAGTTSTNDTDAQQALVQGFVTRDALFTRAQTYACAAYHLVKRTPAGTVSERKGTAATANLDRKAAMAGPVPRVHVTLETRSGNKTATRVYGLESFGLAAGPLAEALQKACASSTSVGTLAGSSPRKPVMEVMVQGSQKDALLKQLEKRGVNKAWVDVTDKTKKKGGR